MGLKSDRVLDLRTSYQVNELDVGLTELKGSAKSLKECLTVYNDLIT